MRWKSLCGSLGVKSTKKMNNAVGLLWCTATEDWVEGRKWQSGRWMTLFQCTLGYIRADVCRWMQRFPYQPACYSDKLGIYHQRRHICQIIIIKEMPHSRASRRTFAGKIRGNLDWVLQVLQSHIQKGKGSCYLTPASHTNCLDTILRETERRGICWAQTFTKPQKSMLEIPLSSYHPLFLLLLLFSSPLILISSSST